MNLASDRLDRRGIYLLEDGHSMIMWISRQAPTELIQQIFGIASLDGVDSAQLVLPLVEQRYWFILFIYLFIYWFISVYFCLFLFVIIYLFIYLFY